MNICLLNRYFDFQGTGVTRIATEVSKELERTGHKVVKVATDGVSLYAYAFQTAIGVPFRLPRKGIDAYHALATLEAMWLPRDRSIATYLDLFTTTNPDLAGAGMGYSKWKLEVGRRYFDIGSRIAAKCRYLVCISEKTKQDVLEYIGADEHKLRVIRLGIPSYLHPGTNIGHDRLVIGALSQLDKRKRIDLLVRDFKNSKLDAELRVAGRGPDRELLENIADGDERIRFLGMITEESLNSFYNGLDLFIFPTAIEGYGLPAVEAMACRKPVVILDDAILPAEIRKHCSSVESLSGLLNSMSSIAYIIDSTDYDDNLKFAQLHSWKNCVAEYVELYKEIAKEE